MTARKLPQTIVFGFALLARLRPTRLNAAGSGRLLPGSALLSLLLLTGATAEAQLFLTADSCIACHNGLSTPAGKDVSLGFAWQPSMMANAARDPYWEASVRRETLDHPQAQAAIQDECSACHMPMTRYQAKAAGQMGLIFAHLAAAAQGTPEALLARDGVSCTVCHQITAAGFGSRESFTGGFVIDTERTPGQRAIYGPYEVEPGLARIMRSATDFQPEKSLHVQESELCATCHTLFTHALGPAGEVVGTLPEQVPYLEWRHSDYREEYSCQDCHMPVLAAAVPVSSVLGQPREGFSRHDFRGGNFFMPRLLNRYRAERRVQASPQELDAAAAGALDHLRSSTARLSVTGLSRAEGTLEIALQVANLAGHKLPTAYPSRRAWLHLTVRDRDGRAIFESGAVQPDGSIRGNDNDEDGRRFEPHYLLIDRPEQVQIYEAILEDHAGEVTTGLLRGLRYVKDNRLLPRGFDKAGAPEEIRVRGGASEDEDFLAAEDLVRYRVALGQSQGPYEVRAEMLYQPIGYRWFRNLEEYQAPEPARFASTFRSMADSSWAVVAETAAIWPPGTSPALGD